MSHPRMRPLNGLVLVLAGYVFTVLAALLVALLWWGGYAAFMWVSSQPWASQWLGWLFS